MNVRREHGEQHHSSVCLECDYARDGDNPGVLNGARQHTKATGHTTHVVSINNTRYARSEQDS